VAAIREGDVPRLRQLLAQDPVLAGTRITDTKGTARTLLHVATDWPGHFPHGEEVIAVLVAAGADVNARVLHADPAGARETPLHWAASADDVCALEALVERGADLEAPGAVFTNGTPMSDAVVFAQWRAARRLLELGAQTTIWQAAALGLLPRVQACLEDRGVGRDQVTNACWHACRAGQEETAGYLIDQGADLDWIGHERTTPLQVAGESGVQGLADRLRERRWRSQRHFAS